MAYIYVITNKINKKQYVGKTNNSIEQRFKEHIRDSRKEHKNHRPLYKAMNKYGVENFEISLLEKCSAECSANKEIYWIGKLNTYGSTGYNATLGGDSKKYYNYDELAKSYLELKSIKKVAELYQCDTQTVSRACKEKGIQIIPASIINKNEKSKPVRMLNKKTYEKIYDFESLSDAANYMVNNNLTNCKLSTIRTHISEVCNKKRKTAAGYAWTFI